MASKVGEVHISGKEIRRYAHQVFPGCRVITRKPSNPECIIFLESGQSIRRKSNAKIANLLTNPRFAKMRENYNWKGLNIAEENPSYRKDAATNAAGNVLYWIEELAEILYPEIEDFDQDNFYSKFRLKVRDNHLFLVVDGEEYGKS